jgi:hypothetical protein
LFLYVLSNPVRLSDPSGRQSADEQVISLSPWRQEGRWTGIWPPSVPPAGPVAGQLAQAFSQADALRNTGLRPILLTQIPGWQGTWASLGPVQGLPNGQYSGLASGVGVQQVFEGGIAGAIHFDVTGVKVLGRGQTSAELRNVITTLQTGGNQQVDVHIFEGGQISTIPRGSTQVVGAPLPERIAERLPNLTPPTAPTTPTTPAPPPAPQAAGGTTAPVGRSSGGSTRSTVGNTAANVGVQVVPGAAEGLVTTEAVGLTAARFGLPRLAAAALSGAKAPGPAVVGGVVGAPAGYLAEGAAREAGLGEGASVAVGAAGAVATGAAVAVVAVLLVATAPVSLTVLAGAAIAGGLAAGFGYLTSRALR